MKTFVCLVVALAFAICVPLSGAQETNAANEPTPTPGISVIKFIAPVYPHLARAARVEGDVRLHLIVSRAGQAENLQIVSGHPMLSQAAVEAAKQWKFGLARPDREVDHEVIVRFRMLDDNSNPDPPKQSQRFRSTTIAGQRYGLG